MKWIESFAYRTPMHWWLFAVAFLIVAIVVCLTVTCKAGVQPKSDRWRR